MGVNFEVLQEHLYFFIGILYSGSRSLKSRRQFSIEIFRNKNAKKFRTSRTFRNCALWAKIFPVELLQRQIVKYSILGGLVTIKYFLWNGKRNLNLLGSLTLYQVQVIFLLDLYYFYA